MGEPAALLGHKIEILANKNEAKNRIYADFLIAVYSKYVRLRLYKPSGCL